MQAPPEAQAGAVSLHLCSGSGLAPQQGLGLRLSPWTWGRCLPSPSQLAPGSSPASGRSAPSSLGSAGSEPAGGAVNTQSRTWEGQSLFLPQKRQAVPGARCVCPWAGAQDRLGAVAHGVFSPISVALRRLARLPGAWQGREGEDWQVHRTEPRTSSPGAVCSLPGLQH